MVLLIATLVNFNYFLIFQKFKIKYEEIKNKKMKNGRQKPSRFVAAFDRAPNDGADLIIHAT